MTKPISWLSGDIAIDLGTANTLIWLRGKGVIINEPSIVARSVHDEKIFAVGNEAKEMVGKTHKEIETIRPLRDGVIADFNMTDGMLQGFIRKVELNRIARVRMVICVPSGVTDVERRAVKDSGERANAKEVFLIEEPVAAAIGIGLDIHSDSECGFSSYNRRHRRRCHHRRHRLHCRHRRHSHHRRQSE